MFIRLKYTQDVSSKTRCGINMIRCEKTAIFNSKLVVSETTWKCGICYTTFPDHNALIEHIVEHFEGLLKQYPYSVQEEIIKRLTENIG